MRNGLVSIVALAMGINAQDTLVSPELHVDEPASLVDGFFAKTVYSRPVESEIHSTMNKVELGFNKIYSEFDLLGEKGKFERPMVEAHLGFEAPLLAYGYGTPGSKSNWGWGMRLPVSIHALEDMWGPETAPVINTDYRFGGPKLVAIRKIADQGWLRDISMMWLPIFHECTHLGDEIVIYRMEENFPIKRINISYEYTEMQVTLNDPGMCQGNCHSLRMGMSYRISDRELGWYSARTNVEIDSNLELAPSTHRAEYYAQYQMQRRYGFGASPRFNQVLSFEFRERLRYGYPLFKKEDGTWESRPVREQMVPNFNLYAGYKMRPQSGDYAVGLFLHAYQGLNPYGQLRNYPSYPFYGLMLNYDL